MNNFKKINPEEITENTFKTIGKDWLLVTAEHSDRCNMMTASWGGLGIMWNKPVAFTFIRPQRYTFDMLENEECFSLCVLGEDYRKALMFCGTKSGRDFDKIKETGLTVQYYEGIPYFEEAKIVMICKKLYTQYLDKDGIIADGIAANYKPDGSDWHKMYISEITAVLKKD